MKELSYYWDSFVEAIRSSFKSIEGSPRELYVIFALKFFESYGYFRWGSYNSSIFIEQIMRLINE